MKFKGKCESCNHDKFFICKRVYKIKQTKELITSKSLLCGKCARSISKMLNVKKQ